jgi:hypothetical protein
MVCETSEPRHRGRGGVWRSLSAPKPQLRTPVLHSVCSRGSPCGFKELRRSIAQHHLPLEEASRPGLRHSCFPHLSGANPATPACLLGVPGTQSGRPALQPNSPALDDLQHHHLGPWRGSLLSGPQDHDQGPKPLAPPCDAAPHCSSGLLIPCFRLCRASRV